MLTDEVAFDRIRGYKRIDGRHKTFFTRYHSSHIAKRCILVPLMIFVSLCGLEVDAAFESIGLTARAMGMGGAYSAVARDTSALIWNPAGVARMSSPEIGISYVELYGLLGYSFIGWGHPIRTGQTVGAAVMSSSDTEGISQERIVLLSAATRIRQFPLHVGVSVKSFSTAVNLEPGVPLGNGAGWGIDLGVHYALKISGGAVSQRANFENIAFGLMLPNLLSRVAYRREAAARYTESLLREWRVGCAVTLNPLLASFELENGQPLIGGEYRFDSGDNTFALRLGWRWTQGVSRGLTIGCGYHGGNLALDYAFVNGHPAVQSSRFSMRLFY